MCKITDFKRDNILNSGQFESFDEYLKGLCALNKKMLSNRNFNNEEIAFMEHMINYYRTIKMDRAYDTISFLSKNLGQVDVAMSVSNKVNDTFHTTVSKALVKHVNYCDSVCRPRLTVTG